MAAIACMWRAHIMWRSSSQQHLKRVARRGAIYQRQWRIALGGNRAVA